jgi:hypothetical protein
VGRESAKCEKRTKNEIKREILSLRGKIYKWAKIKPKRICEE